MTTNEKLELTDPDIFPDDEVLRGILGASYEAYASLLRLFEKHGLTREWRYYLDGKAWLCKVQHKKRTIVWMSAWRGYAQATVYVPGKHLDAAYGLELAPTTIQRIRATKNTGTSKPFTFEIRDESVLGDFETVMRFKMAAK